MHSFIGDDDKVWNANGMIMMHRRRVRLKVEIHEIQFSEVTNYRNPRRDTSSLLGAIGFHYCLCFKGPTERNLVESDTICKLYCLLIFWGGALGNCALWLN